MKFKTSNGYEFEVDDKFDPLIKKFNWYGHVRNGKLHSVTTRVANKCSVRLHRLIAALSLLESIDHKDRNAGNNKAENLRVCTIGENNTNALRPRKVTGYRGICKSRKKWIAVCCYKGVTYRKCSLPTPEAAARAYDELAKNLHGEFAILNFPDKS